MGKKEVVFEGLIDGSYSQILVDRETDKWFLMGQIKNDEIKRVQANIDKINLGKSEEDCVQLVVKRLDRKKAAFLLGEISKESALSDIEKNKENQNRGETRIKDVPAIAGNVYLKFAQSPLKTAGDKIVQKFKSNSLKVAAGALCAVVVFSALVTANSLKSERETPDLTTPPAYVTTLDTPEEPPVIVYERVDLEDLYLEKRSGGDYTSDSVKALARAIVDELDEMYKNSKFELPDIVNVETLSSMFFFENDCCPSETKEDSYVGIAQVGVDAVKAAILRADAKYRDLREGVSFFDNDNYIIDNICSHGRNVENYAETLWEQAKTDPKLCGMIAALYLADLSDRNTTALKENANALVTMYNVGEGNFAYFQQLGIIKLSDDKQDMTIDLSRVSEIQDPDKLKKWNEGVNYLIKVMNGYQALKSKPSAEVQSTCQAIREKVGSDDNQRTTPNTQQYKYAPNGVEFIGLGLEQDVQPGQ